MERRACPGIFLRRSKTRMFILFRAGFLLCFSLGECVLLVFLLSFYEIFLCILILPSFPDRHILVVRTSCYRVASLFYEFCNHVLRLIIPFRAADQCIEQDADEKLLKPHPIWLHPSKKSEWRGNEHDETNDGFFRDCSLHAVVDAIGQEGSHAAA